MAERDLPSSYSWIPKIKGLPKIIVESIDIWGTKEVPGAKSNPIILRWAKDVGVEDEYTNDGIAWCGLTMGELCFRAEKPLPLGLLWALNWKFWGMPVKSGDERLGDIYVTSRHNSKGKLIGGHVGPFLCLDKTHFHVFGGNTSDTCMAARFPFEREHWIRRPIYTNMPEGAKRIIVNSSGVLAGKLT